MTDTATEVDNEIDAKLAEAEAVAAEVRAEDGAASDASGDAAPDPAVPNSDAAPAAEPRKTKSGGDRRPRGWLEADVKRVTDSFVTGDLKLKEGEYLTPHRLSRLVKELDSLDEAPSTGACAAVLDRWNEIGFAKLNETPKAFLDYTDQGRNEGLTAMKAARGEKRKADRKATKEAEKAAAAAAAPAAEPATEASVADRATNV